MRTNEVFRLFIVCSGLFLTETDAIILEKNTCGTKPCKLCLNVKNKTSTIACRGELLSFLMIVYVYQIYI